MRESATYQEILQEGREKGRTDGERRMLILAARPRLGEPNSQTLRVLDGISSTDNLEAADGASPGRRNLGRSARRSLTPAMPTSFGEPLTKLRAVPIRDNGEPLIDPRTLCQRIHLLEKHPRFENLRCVPDVRKSVAEKLAQAADSLPAGIDLMLIEGFRPLSQQRFMYDEVKKHFAKQHPEWGKATLHRRTNQMSAPLDDRCPPPHSTGAAFDCCLCRADSLEFLDMTSPLEWNEASAPTTLPGLSLTAQSNRKLLINTLSATGITNYAGEPWHWSYGDSGWALRIGAKFAIYDRLPDEPARKP